MLNLPSQKANCVQIGYLIRQQVAKVNVCTLSLCSMLRGSYTKSHAFYIMLNIHARSPTLTGVLITPINLPLVAIVMAYGDEIVADLVWTLHWLQEKQEWNSDNI